MPKNNSIVVFDGECQLCNYSVNILKKADKTNRLIFVPYQRMPLNHKTSIFSGVESIPSDSVVVITQGGKVLVKSDAILFALIGNGGAFRLFAILRVVPKFIRDSFYDFIARNRYGWFGKKEFCSL